MQRLLSLVGDTSGLLAARERITGHSDSAEAALTMDPRGCNYNYSSECQFSPIVNGKWLVTWKQQLLHVKYHPAPAQGQRIT